MSSRAEQKARAREARLQAERAAEQAATRRRRLMTFGGILAVAAVIVVVAVLVSQSGGEPETSPSERITMFDGIQQDGTRLGRPDAPVVVEEYADMQCPFCAQFATDQLPSIVSDYVRPGHVQLDLNILTFLGEDSVEAGRFIAATAEQDRLWQAAEAFFSAQGPENSGYVTEAFLRDVARRAGVDADRAFAGRSSDAVRRLLTEARTSAERAEVNSTPTFVVRRGDRQRVVAADGLVAAIDELLQR